LAHEIADELTNAFMIEKNGHASRADVNGHAIPDYQGIWVIYLEAVSASQRHGKWSVWLSLLERFQSVIEVCRFHSFTFSTFRESKANGIVLSDIIAVIPGPDTRQFTGRTAARQ
jgi:hypothetical protein